jgi:GMP synthase (glutamine-hydrolysing)
VRARVFRHLAFEDLGAFAGVLTAAGYAIEYAEMGVDAPDDAKAELLVILGAPIGAYEEALYPWLLDEIKSIAARLKAGAPTVGICLGAQLMARALGARVYPGPAKEIGFLPLILPQENLLSPFQNVPVLHWHGDTFDLPDGAVHLASTRDCGQQAFSYAGHGLAFQFHPEAEPRGFERWLIGHAGEIAATRGVSVPGLREQMRAHGALAAARGREIFARWLADLPH